MTKIIFAGSADISTEHLQALINKNFNIIGCYTKIDKPVGRGKKIIANSVKQLAIDNNIPVYQPKNFKTTDSINEFKNLNPDLMIVVAYGLILPKTILDIPKYGCINVHASILPRWRGASPIQQAVLHGDLESGVTIMQMDEGLDTGDMLKISKLTLAPTETSASLYKKLCDIGPPTLIETINNLENITPVKQPKTGATYAEKIQKSDGLIDWNKSDIEIDRQIRGLNPWPCAFTNLDDLTVKIWEANIIEQNTNEKPGTIIEANKTGINIQTGKNIIKITQLQLPGKKMLSAQDVLNSKRELFTPFKTKFI